MMHINACISLAFLYLAQRRNVVFTDLFFVYTLMQIPLIYVHRITNELYYIIWKVYDDISEYPC